MRPQKSRLRLAAASMVVAAACASACRLSPPVETGSFRPPDLVEIAELDPGIRLDIRYATAENFVGRPVYAEARAFLQRPAAEALVRVHRSLAADGLGIVVFDGYRPWSVTRRFWEEASAEERELGFVADPRKGSRHNRGCAVDVTLYEIESGEAVEMPSGYDEFTERAFPTFEGGSDEARANRDLLRRAMEAEGFSVYDAEWWHFDFGGWKQYRILDRDFDEISR